MSNGNVLRDINNAMNDPDPIHSIASLTIVELWNVTKNPFWIRAWIELNKNGYSNNNFADDLVEVFGL